jgi:PAS domain S-box-containing protein
MLAMNPHLRVLVVEDLEDDMLLLLRELRRGGYTLDSVRVETPEQMQAALDRQAWDIVIADYTLPTFNALEALKLVQAQQRDLPFIIVSGTIGEETAVAAMKAGAHDYITKGNLARLVPAVERELREAEERQKRHQAERALRESEQKIRDQAALLDIASDAIFVRDLSDRMIFWNRGAEKLYGWSAQEILGQTVDRLLIPQSTVQDNDMLQVVLEQGEWQGELRKLHKSGHEVIVATRCTLVCNDAGQPRSILTVDTDITEKTQLQAQFLRAQRLESIGTLASGIAHDFNNLLTPILAISQLLALKLTDLDEQHQHLLSLIQDNAKRGADLVKRILAFARGGDGKRMPLQIRYLLSEVVQVARQTFPKAIEICTYWLTIDLWTVSADASQLHQVFMNLCVNARDAMPTGGILSLSAENLVIDQANAQLNLDAHPGAYVRVTIADTGTGILPEMLERIFDPFFTTKAIGKGTGLGLSTALGIVKNHGGFIKVESEVEHGSQFQVYLPAIRQETIQPDEASLLLSGNNELLLIVEDEPSIQLVTSTLLAGYNYRILMASNGMEAIALYMQHQHDISLVLMDMMMPAMGGLTAIRTLQTLNPNVKVIATSGWAAHEQLSEATQLGVRAFLPKPYPVKDLLEKIHSVLNMD